MEKIKQITYKILKWSEKYTKTDMLYLTKNGFWSIAGTAFATATGLTISIACANLISKDSFGTYKYMISLADIVALVSLTGISTAVTQAVARGFEGALAAGFRVLLKWNILMVMASLAGAVYYFINGDKTLAIAFLLTGALSPLAKGAGLYDAFLQGKKYFKTRTLYSIFRSTISTGLLIIAILLTNSPLIIFFVYLASQTMTATFLYLLTLKKYKPKVAIWV